MTMKAAELQQALSGVEVSDPVTVGRLQVFGLRWAVSNALVYVTLDEALTDEILEITEVSESGNVPTLAVINKSNIMVFLMAGEQLIGAKQNRVLNVSIMIAANSKVPIPVSCVEQRRWNYVSRKFSSTQTVSHSILRKQMAKDVHESYRRNRRPASKQGEVWNEVSRKLGSMGSRSGSEALEQVYQDRHTEMEKIIQEIRIPEDWCGAVFAFDGKIAGMDIFDKPATLSKLMPKLVKSYAIDSLEKVNEAAASRSVDSENVKNWLRSLAEAKFDPFESPGIGTDVRIKSKELVGDSLVVEGCPVHVELFSEDLPSV